MAMDVHMASRTEGFIGQFTRRVWVVLVSGRRLFATTPEERSPYPTGLVATSAMAALVAGILALMVPAGDSRLDLTTLNQRYRPTVTRFVDYPEISQRSLIL